jgi:hypothetical protein
LPTTQQVTVPLEAGRRWGARHNTTARARADDRWEIGERVRLGWHPEHARLLR